MIGNMLNNTVNVQSFSPGQGNNFGEKDTYTTVYANQPCMISSAKTSWIVRYSQKQIDISHTLYFGASITIKAGYRILYGSRVFLVEGIRNPNESNRMTVCDAREITK